MRLQRLLITGILLAIFCLGAVLAPPAGRSVAAVAGSFESFQGYLDPAPLGIDARFAWTLPGGRGENIRIVDIEYSWNLTHTDLVDSASNLFVYVRGVNPLPDPATAEANWNHGTAVLGELVGADNGVGVTGIANRAHLGLINPLISGEVPDVAGAINRAADAMEAGDILLLEQQSIQGPRFDPLTGHGLLPIEFESDVFTAIKAASGKGIVVVESAGNGSEDLDLPIYGGKFDRAQRDSGAIIVGAGLPEGGAYGPGPDRTRTDESNFGSMVDVQAWGRFVATTGYGDQRQGKGQNNWYTLVFGATSGATAMVAGAAAVLQSIVKARGLAPLPPAQIRHLLAATGTPQQGNLSQHIGPRPDLRAAILSLDGSQTGAGPVISRAQMKGESGRLIVDGDHFLVGGSVVEINGQAAGKLKYPAAFAVQGGEITRLMTKADVTALLPLGVEVSLTVFTPSNGKRSAPFSFTR